MIDMNDFRYFMTIVDKGSFTAAGRALGLPTSTLSYRMKQLEEKLGLLLLVRSSRQLSLTDAGEEFYRYALVTVERADEAENAMRARVTEPCGPIRYTTSLATAQFVMPEIINSFMHKYPKITLYEHVTDAFVDIVAERFDLAIRAHTGMLPDSNLIQRPLAQIPWQLFASPSYLKENGEPEEPRDLEKHMTLFVRRENTQARWSLSNKQTGEATDVRISPRLASTCIDCLKSSAKAGTGIVALPTYICRAELARGELKLVLPDWQAANTTLAVIMTNRIGMGAGLRSFIDHISETCQRVISNPSEPR